MTGAWQDFSDAPDQAQARPEDRPAAEDIKARLLPRLREALFYLLPGGKIQGGRFIVGDTQGNKGKSLVVDLAGDKAGVWHDFATGEGGDIFTLWGAVHGLDHQTRFPAILDSVMEWLGTSPRPLPKKDDQAEDLGFHTGKWDYHDAQGDLIACIYRYDTPDGKEFRPWDVRARKRKAPEPRPLYNQPGMLSSPSVVLVEGEKSAQALIDLGICATTAMMGAHAPVDKTDWSPMIGKHVLIWPDNDEAGKRYAETVASRLRTLGILSLAILVAPDDKPQKWDAADAVKEGMDVPAFLAMSPRMIIPPAAALPAFTVGHLLDDDSPMPDDLVEPRILTPGGLLVFGGAPKVGKTDMLISWMAHMAAGLPFLGMKPAKPLKIFYLQAEIGYHYLRERLRELAIDPAFLPLVRRNLVITPQVRMLLDDKGVEMVREAITRFFDPKLLDVIAIDPLRNVFDAGESGNENDNTAMLAFLQDRVEKLRFLVNPDAGIILAHHTKKISKKMLEDDPFQGLSGAGSLRSFYTTGIILFRPDEQQTLRQLIFELRNGKAVPAKWVDKVDGCWREVAHHSARLVNKDYGERLDNERRRRHDVILQLLFDEARKGKLYTPSQFCQSFENKGGLGGNHSIRDRIDVLATKGFIKFNKNNAAKSKYGVMCIEGMEVPTGETEVDAETGEVTPVMETLLPTHFKQSGDGSILPVENPNVWVYAEDAGP